MNARASCKSGPERPSFHAQGPEPRFPCQPPLAPRRWTPRSTVTTGGRAAAAAVVRLSSARRRNPAFSPSSPTPVSTCTRSPQTPLPIPDLIRAPRCPNRRRRQRQELPSAPMHSCSSLYRGTRRPPCFVFRTLGFSVIFRYVFVS
jgi:hypothetical protein